MSTASDLSRLLDHPGVDTIRAIDDERYIVMSGTGEATGDGTRKGCFVYSEEAVAEFIEGHDTATYQDFCDRLTPVTDFWVCASVIDELDMTPNWGGDCRPVLTAKVAADQLRAASSDERMHEALAMITEAGEDDLIIDCAVAYFLATAEDGVEWGGPERQAALGRAQAAVLACLDDADDDSDEG